MPVADTGEASPVGLPMGRAATPLTPSPVERVLLVAKWERVVGASAASAAPATEKGTEFSAGESMASLGEMPMSVRGDTGG